MPDARDEILGLLRTAWVAQTPALNAGVEVLMQWPGEDNAPPSAEAPFGRANVRHNAGRQSTLGPTGTRKFTRSGFVTVQCFAALSGGQGLSLAENLAIIARDAFEGRGTASGIWFRNCKVVEVGATGAWYQMNAVVEFQYDELR